MKDVSDILAQRLERLKKPFSGDWLSDFFLFMQFIQANHLTNEIAESIQEGKEEAYDPLVHNLRALFKDGRNSLKQLLLELNNPDEFRMLEPQIRALLKVEVDHSKIANPFFEFEAFYFDYFNAFTLIIKGDCSK